jgi:hypothetical protein
MFWCSSHAPVACRSTRQILAMRSAAAPHSQQLREVRAPPMLRTGDCCVLSPSGPWLARGVAGILLPIDRSNGSTWRAGESESERARMYSAGPKTHTSHVMRIKSPAARSLSQSVRSTKHPVHARRCFWHSCVAFGLTPLLLPSLSRLLIDRRSQRAKHREESLQVDAPTTAHRACSHRRGRDPPCRSRSSHQKTTKRSRRSSSHRHSSNSHHRNGNMTTSRHSSEGKRRPRVRKRKMLLPRFLQHPLPLPPLSPLHLLLAGRHSSPRSHSRHSSPPCTKHRRTILPRGRRRCRLPCRNFIAKRSNPSGRWRNYCEILPSRHRRDPSPRRSSSPRRASSSLSLRPRRTCSPATPTTSRRSP